MMGQPYIVEPCRPELCSSKNGLIVQVISSENLLIVRSKAVIII